MLTLGVFGAETNSDFAEKLPPLEPLHPEIPATFWEQHAASLLLGAGLLALVLAGLSVWLIFRPRRKVVVSPLAQARQALERLQAQSEDGPALSSVSQALRHYTAAVFSLGPGEMTTSEFCATISNHAQISSDLAGELAEFLRRCDARKFAPARPAPPLHAAAQALNLIERLEGLRTRTKDER